LSAIAVSKLTHKDDYETPDKVFDYICRTYNVNPEIDACASKTNSKCGDNFISLKENFLKSNIIKSFFINCPYRKTEYNSDGGILKPGITEFMHHAYNLHIKNNITVVALVFANSSSTPWFQECVGETEECRRKNHAEVYFYPKRIRFLDESHNPTGSPVFSSLIIIWRRTKIGGKIA